MSRDPHLDRIEGRGPERAAAVKWARYLQATFGVSGSLEALRFYVAVGWISEDVRRTMTDYVRGISVDDDDAPTADLAEELEPLDDTPFQRHAKSLEYVATIANDNISHTLASVSSPDVPGAAPSVSGETVSGVADDDE